MQGSDSMALTVVPDSDVSQRDAITDPTPKNVAWLLGLYATSLDGKKDSPAILTDAGLVFKELRRDRKPVSRAIALHQGWADLWKALPFLNDFCVLSVAVGADQNPFYANQRRVRIPGNRDFDAMLDDIAHLAWEDEEWPFRRYSLIWGQQKRIVGMTQRELNWNVYGKVVPYNYLHTVISSALSGKFVDKYPYRGSDPLMAAIGVNKMQNSQWFHTFALWNERAYGYWIGQIDSFEQLEELMALPVTILFAFQKVQLAERILSSDDVELQMTVIVRAESSYANGAAPELDAIGRRLKNILITCERCVGDNVRWAFLSMVPAAPLPPAHMTLFHHCAVPQPENFMARLTSHNNIGLTQGAIWAGKGLKTRQSIFPRIEDRESVVVKGLSGFGKTSYWLIVLLQIAGNHLVIVSASAAQDESALDLIPRFGGTIWNINLPNAMTADEIRADARSRVAQLRKAWEDDPSRLWQMPLLVRPEILNDQYYVWLEEFIPAMRSAWGFVSQIGGNNGTKPGVFAGQTLYELYENASVYNKTHLKTLQDIVLEQVNNGKNERTRTHLLIHENQPFEQRLEDACKLLVDLHHNAQTNERTAIMYDADPSRKQPMSPTIDVKLPGYLLRWTQRRDG